MRNKTPVVKEKVKMFPVKKVTPLEKPVKKVISRRRLTQQEEEAQTKLKQLCLLNNGLHANTCSFSDTGAGVRIR